MISPLRLKRFFSELTLYDLGLLTGIDPARLSLIERNYKIPRPDEKERLANALRCNSSEIFPDENKSPGEEVMKRAKKTKNAI
jgi:transcriptional regulator with XRE-family HTH domain